MPIAQVVVHRNLIHLPEYRILVCTGPNCQHAVWPSEARRHFRGTYHRLDKTKLQELMSIVQGLKQIAYKPDELPYLQQTLLQPIPHLNIYHDGFLCQVTPEHCQYVCRSEKNMATHCLKKHSWKRYACKGRPTNTARRVTGQTIPDPWRRTACQRLFPSRHGSSFFAVGIDEPGMDEDNISADGSNEFLELMRGAVRTRDKKEQAVNAHVDSRNVFEIDPWVERAGWHEYLDTLKVDSLLALIDKPNPKDEPTLTVIWNAMEELYRTCNKTVDLKAGIFIRQEAIRDQMHQQLTRPLQSYQGKNPPTDHCRPWQMVLMFFGRTWPLADEASPRYALNKRQEHTLSALLLAAETQAEQREGYPNTSAKLGESDTLSHPANTCLSFCLALLDQRVRCTEYESALVCALALQGISAKGWRECGQYTKTLSAMIKLSRFMVVQAAIIADAEATNLNAGQEVPEGRCLRSVSEMMDKFMVRGTNGPMQWMLDLRTYGFKIHYSTTSEGEVEWINDEILYTDIRFTMPEFRSFVHGLVAKVERIVYQDLLFSTQRTEIPSVAITTLQDDTGNSLPGWNFLQDSRNKHVFHTKDWLVKHVALDKARRAAFKLPRPEGGPNKPGIKAYLGQVKTFLQKLLVLIHVVGGLPGRGTEILSVRHSNTVAGKHRNVFIINGMVAFVPRYSKGSRHAGRSNVIHRFLPDQVGKLVILYLWLILPFQRAIEQIVWPDSGISHEMWPPDEEGKKWNTERFRRILQQETEAGLGCRLNIQVYRHIAIAISRKYLKTQSAFAESDNDTSLEKDDLELANAIHEEQAGHTPWIGESIYARLVGELAGSTASKRQRFQRSSIEWHNFLEFPSSTSSRDKKRAIPIDATGNAKRTRWRELRAIDTATQLKAIYGNEAQFRGVQQIGVDTILRGDSPVVIIMPTGGGKSLMFMLPAACNDAGLTVVVVPLLALQQDLLQRCQSVGLLAVAWNRRSPPDAASIVFVTPELVEEDAFQVFMNRMRSTGRLARIVIDECHTVLDGRSGFRPSLQRLGRLAAMQAQMVLLTATLPPTEEQRLWRKMQFTAESVTLIRAPTTRSNIRYLIIDMDKEPGQSPTASAVEQAMQSISKHIAGLPQGRRKTIVYCHTIEMANSLGHSFDCAAYHSRVIDRERVLERFISSRNEMIVATSSLGLGIDARDVEEVYHVGAPRSLVDYAQESGRVGRDGRVGRAVIFLGRRVDAPLDGNEGRRAALPEYVQREADVKTCRRVVIDKYMDGNTERKGCTDGEELCDICAAEPLVAERVDTQSAAQEPAASVLSEADEAEFRMQERRMRVQRFTVTASVKSEQLTLERLERSLVWWTIHCPICMAQDSEALHDLRTCTTVVAGRARDAARKLRQKLRFAKFSGCYFCTVPQELCNRWTKDPRWGWRRSEDQKCRYHELVVWVLVAITMAMEDVREAWIKRLEGYGIEFDDMQNLATFLSEKIEGDRLEIVRLVVELDWFTEVILRRQEGRPNSLHETCR